MELKTIHYAVERRVATITLNRPHRLNAWTGRMNVEYRWALDQAECDSDVRVIVVTGAGRAFCAGADFQALEGHIAKGRYDPGTTEDMAQPGYGIRPEFDAEFAYHFGLTKPTIAAINGAAAGIGLVLACFLDLRFSAAGAKFTAAHGKLSLPAEYGLSWLLPRMIGITRANDVLLSSRTLLAEEAYELGMLNKVLPPEEVLSHAHDYAHNLAATVSPGSLRETKRQIYLDLHRDVASSVRASRQLLDRMMTEKDFSEGVRAFREKRPPAWSGA